MSEVRTLKDKLKSAIANNKIYGAEIYVIGNLYNINNIYQIDENVLAVERARKNAKKEHKIITYLFEKKIAVPEAYELIKPDFPLKKLFNTNVIDNWYLTFKKIDGSKLENLTGETLRLANKQYKEELEKTLANGICPIANYWSGKPIFNLAENKIYLTNFENWAFGSKKEIDMTRRQLERMKLI
jgi:hypothetical protein